MGSWQKFKEDFKKQADEMYEAEQQEKKKKKARLKEYDKLGIPYCPKCKSTRVEYIERRKKLSVGRAIVGDVLAGPTGAILGGLTSKKRKGRVKCINCGKEWKIK